MDREAAIRESIAGHQARNAELALRLKEKGADMNRLYTIEHHFWASNQRDAAHLAKRLYEKGYLITAIDRLERDAGSEVWNISTEIQRTPTEAISEELTGDLVRTAAEYAADYDGWGMSI